jgi:hypothetical protein
MSIATETNITIMPTRSANLVSDSGLEGTYTGGLCTAFRFNSFGTPTEDTTTVHGGTSAQSLLAMAQNQLADLCGSSYTQYGWYDISFWSKRAAGTGGGVNLVERFWVFN